MPEMPETAQAETPGRRVMRQWFQGKLAERMVQAGQMAQNRAMLRRGAMKQQDGTLGQPGEPAEAEEMNIRVGDEMHFHPSSEATAQSSPESSLLSKALPYVLTAALAGGGTLGVAQLAGLFDRPDPTAVVDTDTTRRIEIEKYIPE